MRGYTYTANGQKASLTDANGHVTQYSYDGLDRLTQTSYADASTESYSYDAAGNRLGKTTRSGQTIAEVTQPVYDTATGRYLLIPQGSRLIGRYDSQVAFGQRRVLLVWLRLVLPDTSSVALDKLLGIDPACYAGLEDGAGWHWGRILAGAALSTLLGVSSELAVSNEGDISGNTVIALRDSAQDTANQVGQEITRRNLSIQPTLTVWPGFPVDVMVNKDLVLRPYQPLFIQRRPMP